MKVVITRKEEEVRGSEHISWDTDILARLIRPRRVIKRVFFPFSQLPNAVSRILRLLWVHVDVTVNIMELSGECGAVAGSLSTFGLGWLPQSELWSYTLVLLMAVKFQFSPRLRSRTLRGVIKAGIVLEWQKTRCPRCDQCPSWHLSTW